MAYDSGDFPGLMTAFVEAGLPLGFALAVDVATRLTREPITLMLPVLWLVLQAEREQPTVVETPVPPLRLHRGIPLYALDKHTAAGKRALGVFVTENQRVADTIAEYAPDFRARDIAAMAAFYADAAPVSRRLEWSQSRELEAIGLDTDMRHVGCPPSGVLPIAQVVREELDHLNDIRCRMLGRASRGRQRALPLDGEA